ncbi:MAG: D-aminoacyl-tRNA deacylase [Candidatus Micrarchaeales archaeon]
MVFIVYSLLDQISTSAAAALKEYIDFEEVEAINGLKHFKYDKVDLLELTQKHLDADFLDNCIKTDAIIFLSRHGSNKDIPAFTAHPEGNWSNEAKLGGKPKELAFAAPILMAKVLQSMKNNNKTDIEIVYEATHHGPLLKTPSLYAEIGGNDETRANKEFTKFLAKSVFDSIDLQAQFDKIAFGIGSLHYADRFTRMALAGKYAFSHIMSKHYADNTDMIEQAIERSVPKAEVVLIEWKGINAQQREKITAKLDEIGIDYEKIR